MKAKAEGYTIGRSPGSGEVGTRAVCEHGHGLGMACPGCAERRGTVGTAPAGPRADTLYRAVCEHCGSRVWLPSADVPELVRDVVDTEEAEALAASKARQAEAFRS